MGTKFIIKTFPSTLVYLAFLSTLFMRGVSPQPFSILKPLQETSGTQHKRRQKQEDEDKDRYTRRNALTAWARYHSKRLLGGAVVIASSAAWYWWPRAIMATQDTADVTPGPDRKFHVDDDFSRGENTEHKDEQKVSPHAGDPFHAKMKRYVTYNHLSEYRGTKFETKMPTPDTWTPENAVSYWGSLLDFWQTTAIWHTDADLPEITWCFLADQTNLMGSLRPSEGEPLREKKPALDRGRRQKLE